MVGCPGLQELKELVASYQTLREGGRGPAICSTIISTARQCNMEKDCSLPPDETDTKELQLDSRDEIVGKVYQKCAPHPLACPLHAAASYLLSAWRFLTDLVACRTCRYVGRRLFCGHPFLQAHH